MIKNSLFSLTIIFLLSSIECKSQNFSDSVSKNTNMNKLSLGLGTSLFGAYHYTWSLKPAYLLRYDRSLFKTGVNSYVSSGLNFTHQHWQLYEPRSISVSDTLDQDIRRSTLGLRFIINFRTNKKLKFYSGIMGYYNLWNIKDNHGNKVEINDFAQRVSLLVNFIEWIFTGSTYVNYRTFASFKTGLQFIPIGANFDFNENFALNMELSILSPYYFSGGISYSF